MTASPDEQHAGRVGASGRSRRIATAPPFAGPPTPSKHDHILRRHAPVSPVAATSITVCRLPRRSGHLTAAGTRAAPSRLYEGGRFVNPCVRLLTPQVRNWPGERCRVKRLSKATWSKQFGSWRLTRQREPGRKLLSRPACGSAGWSGAHFSSVIELRGLGAIEARSGGAVPKGTVRQSDER